MGEPEAGGCARGHAQVKDDHMVGSVHLAVVASCSSCVALFFVNSPPPRGCDQDWTGQGWSLN